MSDTTLREFVTRWGFSVDDQPLKTMERQIDSLIGLTKQLAFSFATSSFGIGAIVREAGKMEQTKITFTTLLNSAEKADAFLEKLFAFAAKTPFTIPGIEKSAKQLLAVGIPLEDVLPNLKALGDIAAGTSAPLERIALAFGDVRAKGKLTGEEMRQFTNAGISLRDELAKNLKRELKDIPKLMEAGKISFKDVEQAFRTLTSEGGKFNNLMIKQSTSLFGVFSNLKDLAIIFARNVGQVLLPDIKAIALEFLNWFEANKKLIKQKSIDFFKVLLKFMRNTVKVIKALLHLLKPLINAFGGLENAIIAVSSAMLGLIGIRALQIMGSFVTVIWDGAKALGKMALGFNAAGKAALFFNLKAFALPLLLGAVVAGILLILDDLIAFMQGRDSLIGLLVEDFEKNLPQLMKTMEKMEEQVTNFFKGIVRSVVTALVGDEFDKERDKLAMGLARALDVAIIASGFAGRIGIAIGQAIVDGMVEAIVRGFPKMARVFGLMGDKEREAVSRARSQKADSKFFAGELNKLGTKGFFEKFGRAPFASEVNQAVAQRLRQKIGRRPTFAEKRTLMQSGSVTIPVRTGTGELNRAGVEKTVVQNVTINASDILSDEFRQKTLDLLRQMQRDANEQLRSTKDE